ncbi:cystathionine beta-lyase [Anoxybacillus tepidamans]|uniref:cysteine-S-conjugate beta-lyase n=1 Tax=Anoxybacteroides tepidamans TaxID=265948 RepID=A0A7W8MUM9_9BACL|nr:MalY/PatB family protein [Anoxybacillus tepidamans]MBB5324404.1 cystathionine beta-lyase [Anoxybacillus tepidamans]
MYSFDHVIERRHTYSVKWDETERFFGVKDVLPMWVADMDFQAPPAVIEAMTKRVEHGVFGYTAIPRSLKEALSEWLTTRHQWTVHPDWMSFSTGVVPALATAIEAFTSPNDRIVVFSPVYPPLFQLVQKNGRELVKCPLRFTEKGYEINWDDLQEKLKGAKMLLLCSPHNPGGRVWTKEELTTLGTMCLEKGVIVVSDEIHADLTLPPFQHTPFASIDEAFANMSVTCVAPTKTFNLAGLQCASIIIPNRSLKKQFDAAQQRQGFFTLNTFAVVGAEAAYRHGGEWLDALLMYIQKNIEMTCSFIDTSIQKLRAVRPEATYLVWIDCRELGITEQQLKQLLLHKGKIAVEMGSKFGEEGRGFIRLNIACTRKTLEDALNRLAVAFEGL